MATEEQFIMGRYGANARASVTQNTPLVVSGNSTVKGQMVIPTGSWLEAFTIQTPAAISGTPTSCLVSIGTTDGGADIVAAVDAKAQGRIAATLLAAFDGIAGLAALTTIYIQVVTSGGTASAGTINVRGSYAATPQS